MKRDDSQYREVLKDESHLALFLRNMADFDKRFCDMMVAGRDFNIRLEIHGNVGKLLYCRVHSDSYDRPPGTDQKPSRQK